MNLKLFDINEGLWIDVSGTPGASLEYNDVSGWVVGSGYKSYVAQLSQTGSDIPTAIVLENNLGFIPDWKYDSTGIYGFDWDVDFDYTKCFIFFTNGISKSIWYMFNDVYDVSIRTDNDNWIENASFELRYYN